MSRYRLAGVVMAMMLCTGCIIPTSVSMRPSGNVVTREFAYEGFDRVEVSHAFTVSLRQGNEYAVAVRVDEKALDYLRVSQQGNTLSIGLKPGFLYNMGRMTLEADVAMPRLAALDLSGASKGTLSGFESGDAVDLLISGASTLEGSLEAGDAKLTVSGASTARLNGSLRDVEAVVSGASTLELSDLAADEVELEVSGASTATLGGSGGRVDVSASGASRVDLGAFEAEDADVEAEGASRVTVSASGTLNARASGASHVYYTGDPRLGRVDVSGASRVQRQ